MPSLFGALDTAVSGLTAQSAAFGNISDNIANSQTTGFKGTDTSFADYLSTSTAVTNDSGSVIARPEYQNETQGSISSSTDALALAISGQGFFQVEQQSGDGANTQLSSAAEYTRDGDFSLDSQGYLVNGSQQVLTGWMANSSTGAINTATQAPIVVDTTTPYPAVATANVTLSANLPALTYVAGNAEPASFNVYDADGNLHTIDLSYVQNAANDWTVSLYSPDDTSISNPSTTALGSAELKFGATTSGNSGTPAGTLGSISNLTNVTATNQNYSSSSATQSEATLSFSTTFNDGAQTINLNLGQFGSTSGLTQFAGTAYTPGTLTQDGAAKGNYTGTTAETNGDIVNTYDNGKSKVVAQVPVALFANADALQRQDGQGYVATTDSGAASVKGITDANGSTLAVSSVEASNVDIATEFTKLIVAQQAYAANSKVVTTAADMLTQTIDMKQ